MAKVRKTRQAKIATTTKRQESQFTYSYSHATKPQVSGAHQTSAYDYVTHDVQKTFIVSLSLILLQIVLFILLQHHVIKIPGVTY